MIMNYQSIKIINPIPCIWLVTLATFLSHCSSSELGRSTGRNWDGVQHAGLKKKFKAFVGEWEGMPYDNFLIKVAKAVKNRSQAASPSKQNKRTVAYYIPVEYIPTEDERTIEKMKRGPFYRAVFQQEYSKISGELKKIYDNLLILPQSELVRSKDANLFVVACFLKFTEEVDKVLKDTDLDNDAVIGQLKKLLDEFRDEVRKVDRKSGLYPAKKINDVAMGIMVVPDSEGRITFEKNTVASFSMNERCMLTRKSVLFVYEQWNVIKAEIDQLDSALKVAAEKMDRMAEE